MAPSLTKLLPPTPPTPSPASHLLKPTTQPIPRNNSLYNHIHTPLVLAYYAIRFNALVADPLQTMIQDLLPLALAQSLFCATCLPPAGTWGEGKAIISGTSSGNSKAKTSGGSSSSSSSSNSSSTRKRGPGATKKDHAHSPADAHSWASKIVPTILSLMLTVTVPTLPLFALCLVLGAPLWPHTQLPHTLLLAAHASLLAGTPLFYAHGVDGGAWRDVLAAWLPVDGAGVWAGALGCVVGGWAGAVPIALDWDREWQAWPCTVLAGVVLGWAFGRLFTVELGLGVGRRIDLGEQRELESGQNR